MLVFRTCQISDVAVHQYSEHTRANILLPGYAYTHETTQTCIWWRVSQNGNKIVSWVVDNFTCVSKEIWHETLIFPKTYNVY